VGPDDAREFVASNHRAVLITRRSGGGLQTSPVLVGGRRRGEAGHLHQGGRLQTRNLRRDPTAVLCVVSAGFFDGWIQIEGGAGRVAARAMDGLVDYYRRISGEHPDWTTTSGPCSSSGGC
jgi:PPOX class probable F420-dependent enzyme